MKATYIAMTTHNYQMSGFHIILAAGHNKQAVRDAAEAKIIGHDIYADTERKNLVVVSKTKAKKLGFDWSQWIPRHDDPTERYEWVR